MYIPKLYRVERSEQIVNFMKAHPFGVLVTFDGEKPIATHVPFEVRETDDRIFISGHLAYANPQKETLANNSNVLVIFHGPHTYISSSWYEHENVPTWNYMAVHAYGDARILTDTELRDALRVMLETHESHRPNGRLWETFDPEYLEQQLKGIVGFEIEVSLLEAAAKMSQNRNDTDYRNVVDELKRSNSPADNEVGQLMDEMRPTQG